jgi:hypothetical protein
LVSHTTGFPYVLSYDCRHWNKNKVNQAASIMQLYYPY